MPYIAGAHFLNRGSMPAGQVTRSCHMLLEQIKGRGASGRNTVSPRSFLCLNMSVGHFFVKMRSCTTSVQEIGKSAALLSSLQVINVGPKINRYIDPVFQDIVMMNGVSSVSLKDMIEDPQRIYTFQVDYRNKTIDHVPDCLAEYRKWLLEERPEPVGPKRKRARSKRKRAGPEPAGPKRKPAAEPEPAGPKQKPAVYYLPIPDLLLLSPPGPVNESRASCNLKKAYLECFESFPETLLSRLKFDITADLIFGLLSKEKRNVGSLSDIAACWHAMPSEPWVDGLRSNQRCFIDLLKFLVRLSKKKIGERQQLAFTLFKTVIARNIEWARPGRAKSTCQNLLRKVRMASDLHPDIEGLHIKIILSLLGYRPIEVSREDWRNFSKSWLKAVAEVGPEVGPILVQKGGYWDVFNESFVDLSSCFSLKEEIAAAAAATAEFVPACKKPRWSEPTSEEASTAASPLSQPLESGALMGELKKEYQNASIFAQRNITADMGSKSGDLINLFAIRRVDSQKDFIDMYVNHEFPSDMKTWYHRHKGYFAKFIQEAYRHHRGEQTLLMEGVPPVVQRFFMNLFKKLEQLVPDLEKYWDPEVLKNSKPEDSIIEYIRREIISWATEEEATVDPNSNERATQNNELIVRPGCAPLRIKGVSYSDYYFWYAVEE